MKKYRNKSTGEEIETDGKPNKEDNIGLFVFRSASLLTGIDFTYMSVNQNDFNKQYEEVTNE